MYPVWLLASETHLTVFFSQVSYSIDISLLVCQSFLLLLRFLTLQAEGNKEYSIAILCRQDAISSQGNHTIRSAIFDSSLPLIYTHGRRETRYCINEVKCVTKEHKTMSSVFSLMLGIAGKLNFQTSGEIFLLVEFSRIPSDFGQ